jgi:Protein of unknown function (DUF3106)
MTGRLQFAGWLVALGMTGALLAPFTWAQRGNGAQSRPANKPAAQHSQPPRQQPPRQQQRQESRQPQQTPRAQNQRQNSGGNRPPNANVNRADIMGQPNINPNRPPSAYTPPPPKRFNSLPRQEQQKILQNNKSFEKLPPAQKQQMREAAANWSRLTPEQRNHVKNDVLPQWKQLPPERQRAIQQRLGVLQNMPESARNQHLNDPNFTRGMNEQDKAMLRDLSHLHVGAPDPPNE